MGSIMPAFEKFPDEGAAIGRILAGYGELELLLCQCVDAARNDFDMVFRVMFRPRGEKQRIDVADAMGLQPFQGHGLGTQFSMMIGATRHCLKIRNQYAHCCWTDNFGRGLRFVKLEDTAHENTANITLYTIPAFDIDMPTLILQENYFCYTRDWMAYLEHEARLRRGSISTHPFQAPKQLKPALLCKP